MSDSINLSKNVESLDISPSFAEYSRVLIWTGEETNADGKTVKTYVASGNETGRTLELTCPWATQATANNILSAIRGFRYQPMTVTGAILDPAAEIGDGVTANGIYSGIYEQTETYTRRHLSDISAPTEEEIDHEFPFQSKADRQTERRYRQTRAQLQILTDEVAAKVESEYDGTAFGWRLISDEFSVYSGNASNKVLTVTKDGLRVKGEIRADSGYIGGTNGWTIKDGCICTNNKIGFDEKGAGIYIGTNGINLNDNFRVDSSGKLNATTGTFSGEVYAGKISYGGKKGTFNGEGLSDGSVGGGGSGGGGSGKIKGGTVNSGDLTRSVQNLLADIVTCTKMLAGNANVAKMYVTDFRCGAFKLDNTTGSWTQKYVDGQTIRYLGW